MKKHLSENRLEEKDEAWLVVDRDKWDENHLKSLHVWSTENDRYGFALSNPKFEYWLLLHFEEGKGVRSANAISDRLRNYLPDYDKHIDPMKFTDTAVEKAVERARQKDTPPCEEWLRGYGSTVYRLVERLMEK